MAKNFFLRLSFIEKIYHFNYTTSMLPIYFFTVFFCVFSGFLFSVVEKGKLKGNYTGTESLFYNKTFYLLCAVVAILLAICKVFLPVKANSADGTMYLIGDLLPIFMCVVLFFLFSFRYFSAVGKSDTLPEFTAQLNGLSVIIGYLSFAVGILHLFFAHALIL